ncbi:zinc carboxypeptidase [Chitinophaga pendula]|uniref:M14 metallopeptidase family protein n=1 Tax=Chitinophaga TaxID=79328 RepID=UPI000BB070B0|nr:MULTISPECIES: M14 metallopeptidase family protein [Chitinophaga]ASZ12040.1 zinc carboxypeptidase [Chitinophaga sp. MD30]UCJ04927.1 zinc carboxypeptidase [Chitinophaga pendula]
MLKKIIAASIICCLFLSTRAQQLQSPEQFLGYQLGQQFTPHYKVIEYFKAVAAATPNMQLQTYGSTYEGRPLITATITAPANFSRLDEIRRRNLSLTTADGNPADLPVIVWLSYNVHGNEAVSTEAAMRTIYLLADKNNTTTQQWLQNTIVIIDPCLNPDGRERYVSFYNQTRSLLADPARYAREHWEPWPGGRSNHYYFDLNRDWAWQTQTESRQRVATYNQWMPHVHVDFHEQEIEAPYYFAPAAEPIHEVITPWQRELQTLIGKNNAKYFDEKGWLYFTKERFDLFYPSYGDTYPTYNGAVGMTYEQGGSGRAGIAVLKRDGDTLTLTDRIAHHVTTGLSTLEVSSQQATRIMKAFTAYFTDAKRNPIGNYKTYVVKAAGNEEKLASLADLLKKNQIRFGYGATQDKANGFSYATGRSESFSIAKEDMVINAFQTQSNMLKVLFEPVSRLSDSVTYDITAWALPYAYGLPAYAVPQSIQPAQENLPAINNTTLAANRPYAYLAKWNSVKDVKFLSAILRKGIKVRYAETPFSATGRKYPAGTLIITRSGNETIPAFDDTITSLANTFKTTLDAVSTGFVEKGMDFGSDKVHYIRPLKVAMIIGEETSSLAAGEIWHFFEQQIQYPLTIINEIDIDDVDWKNIDVLILPNGDYSLLREKEKVEKLKAWINAGGRLVALQHAVKQLAAGEWGIKEKKEDDEKEKDKEKSRDNYALLKPYGNRERDYIKQMIPGAVYKVQMDNTHPLAFGYPDYYYTLKQDASLYEFMENGWNVGVLKKDNYMAGFVGTDTRAKLKDGWLFGARENGNGTIVMLADDPLFRSFWENGKLLFSNAVFLVGE